MKILITGIAGFIGNALALHLARQGHSVAGIDNINAYYDPRLKIARQGDAVVRPSACGGRGGGFPIWRNISFGNLS